MLLKPKKVYKLWSKPALDVVNVYNCKFFSVLRATECLCSVFNCSSMFITIAGILTLLTLDGVIAGDRFLPPLPVFGGSNSNYTPCHDCDNDLYQPLAKMCHPNWALSKIEALAKHSGTLLLIVGLQTVEDCPTQIQIWLFILTHFAGIFKKKRLESLHK